MKVVETGDIAYFYRNRVDVERATSINDIQSLYMVLHPDSRKRARMLIVGKKRIPAIKRGQSHPEEREWAMTVAIGNTQQLANALAPVTYETKTCGKRVQGEAIPVAEGRYRIVRHEANAYLQQQLERPESPGKPQRALRLHKSADYVFSVRNPNVNTPGFPDKTPDYPTKIHERFADERWLPADDPQLLNYENAQCLIIGAQNKLADSGPALTGKPRLLRNLGVIQGKWPLEGLEKGIYARVRGELEPRHRSAVSGEKGGKAALDRPSAAGLAKALSGANFPCKHAELVSTAKHNRASKAVKDCLDSLPAKTYRSMSDVQKALGEVR